MSPPNIDKQIAETERLIAESEAVLETLGRSQERQAEILKQFYEKLAKLKDAAATREAAGE